MDAERVLPPLAKQHFLLKNKSLDFAVNLKPEDINLALKGLPEDHKHCTELAVRTLRLAINKYKDNLLRK